MNIFWTTTCSYRLNTVNVWIDSYCKQIKHCLWNIVNELSLYFSILLTKTHLIQLISVYMLGHKTHLLHSALTSRPSLIWCNESLFISWFYNYPLVVFLPVIYVLWTILWCFWVVVVFFAWHSISPIDGIRTGSFEVYSFLLFMYLCKVFLKKGC